MHEKTFEYFGLNCFDDGAQVSKLLLLIYKITPESLMLNEKLIFQRF